MITCVNFVSIRLNLLENKCTVVCISLRDFNNTVIPRKWLELNFQSPIHFGPPIPIVDPWETWISAPSTFLIIAQNVKKVRTLKMLSLEHLTVESSFVHQMKAFLPKFKIYICFFIYTPHNCKYHQLTSKF